MIELMMVRKGNNATPPLNLSEAIVTLSQNNFIFDGASHCPHVDSVILNSAPLIENQDYACVYVPATNVGQYKILVFGVLNYSGVIEVSWGISQATAALSLSSANVTVKGIRGTVNTSISIIKPALCKVIAYGDEYVKAEVTIDNKLKLTSLKAGIGHVTVSVDDNNFIDNSVTLTVSVEKENSNIRVEPAKVTIKGTLGNSAKATITTVGNGQISIGASNYANITLNNKELTITSKAPGNEFVTITLLASEDYLESSFNLELEIIINAIYGVSTYMAGPKIVRTDDAALFEDPTPAIGNGTGSSPFDNLMPWAGMKIVEKDGNSLVSIPKFWYKITVNSSGYLDKIQVANYAAPDFKVSPAHMDRGDGVGERDWIYVGRYHCAEDNYLSKTKVKPKVSDTRPNARNCIKQIGTGYYMWDFALWRTIQMLYIVEFANWDSQAVIGYGARTTSSTAYVQMGYTDNMQYHTGTTHSSRNTHGVGIQYRHIEGLWDNVADWLDGICGHLISNKPYVYISNNYLKYNDYWTEYTQLYYNKDYYTSGSITYFTALTNSEYDWAFYPKSVYYPANFTYGIPDYYYVEHAWVYVGYNESADLSCGLFFHDSTPDGYNRSHIGSRLQYLPQSAHEEITNYV